MASFIHLDPAVLGETFERFIERGSADGQIIGHLPGIDARADLELSEGKLPHKVIINAVRERLSRHKGQGLFSIRRSHGIQSF